MPISPNGAGAERMSGARRSGLRPALGANFLYGMLVLVVCLAPLPFGSNRPWSWSLLCAATALLLGLFVIFSLINPNMIRVSKRRMLGLGTPVILVLAWAYAQTLPLWPHEVSAPAWRFLESDFFDLGPRWPMAVDPDEGQTQIMRLLAYVSVFWISLNLARQQHLSRVLWWSLVIAGVGYAVYGLVGFFGNDQTILGYPKIAYRGSLTSTFINRNSYATYAGLGLVITVALLLHSLLRFSGSGRGLRALIVVFVDTSGTKPFLLGAAALVLACALLLTGSRGGMLATAAGLVVVVISWLFRLGKQSRLAWVGLIVFGIAALSLLALSGGNVLDRLLTQNLSEAEGTANLSRLAIYQIALEAVAGRPWSGYGLGGFMEVLVAHRDLGVVDEWFPASHAHNTYLELMLELGIPATLVFLSVQVAVFVRLIAALRSPDADVWRGAVIGVGVVVVIASHALVDFSVQMPAIAMTYSVVLATSYACALPHRQKYGASDSSHRSRRRRPNFHD